MGEPQLSTVPVTLEPQLGTIESTTSTKPGFKTSEFWLKIAAFVLTTLLASGAIPTNGQVAQIIAMISTMLGSIVYTAARTSAKNTLQDGAQ